jgi:MFS family permease
MNLLPLARWCIALAAVVAAMSSLNVAIPSIARATHASQTQLAWIIDAYSLVFAALLLPAGALGDRFGGPVAAKADTAFIDGVHIALYTAAGAAALAAVVVFLLLSRHTSRPATASTSHYAAPKVEVPA